jgi:histidinol-phosphate aminotransferase
VAESKARLYQACARWGLPYWPSAANFVLVRTGEQTQRVLEGVRARGIYVRDRSSEPGCAGCIRITTGVTTHTDRLLAAIEEIVCGAQ